MKNIITIDRFTGNGYDWRAGKSNNAVSADNDDSLRRLSEITKTFLKQNDILEDVLHVKEGIRRGYARYTEAHHTSRYFNLTPYYSAQNIKDMIASEDYQCMDITVRAKRPTDKVMVEVGEVIASTNKALRFDFIGGEEVNDDSSWYKGWIPRSKVNYSKRHENFIEVSRKVAQQNGYDYMEIG